MPRPRYYDHKNHCCSHCGMLMDYPSFKYHSLSDCFMIEVKNMELEKKLKEFKGGEK